MFLLDIFDEIYDLFFEMAPYIMLGLVFVGILKMYFSKDLIIRHVGKNDFKSVLKAAIFGIPLPLCSCGVVPTAVYMAKNGASRGSVVSFLISTPQTGIDSIIATYGMMGWVFAIFRPFAALLMGVFGGLTIKLFDKAKDEPPNERAIHSSKNKTTSSQTPQGPLSARFKAAVKYSFTEFLDDISVQFTVGLIIAGLIAYFLPDGFFADSAFSGGFLGMALMIAVGIPMYICATASIPIALTLMMKGLSPGVAFVFLAVGPATNIASITVLSKALGKKITGVYLLTIAVSAIAMGYLLDFIFSLFPGGYDFAHCHVDHVHSSAGIINKEIELVIGLIFLILLMLSIYRKKIAPLFLKREIKMTNNDKTISIEGMTCNHCVQNVQSAIVKVTGVESVVVDLAGKSAVVKGSFSSDDVIGAIENVGYKASIKQ